MIIVIARSPLWRLTVLRLAVLVLALLATACGKPEQKREGLGTAPPGSEPVVEAAFVDYHYGGDAKGTPSGKVRVAISDPTVAFVRLRLIGKGTDGMQTPIGETMVTFVGTGGSKVAEYATPRSVFGDLTALGEITLLDSSLNVTWTKLIELK